MNERTNYMYEVEVLSDVVSDLSQSDISKTSTDLVWCVTTNNGTFIARRNGKVYITGNSIVQGNAEQSPYSLNPITQGCAA